MSAKSQRSSEDNDNCKVYISNINKSIEEDDIRRKFSEFGVIKSLILKKKQNNVTYSFIQYEKPEEARASITEMDKKTYFDRILKVEYGKGGHRGLEHYHTNRYDKPGQDGKISLEQKQHYSRNEYVQKRQRSFSYDSQDSYADRYKRNGSHSRDSRSPRQHYRGDFKPNPSEKSRHRERQRSYERPERDYRRDYHDDRRYKEEDRYRKRDYEGQRYRDQDKYRSYRRSRSYQRRDYDKYEKDGRKQYRQRQPDRYYHKEDRYYKDDRYRKDDRYYKESDRYPRDDKYVGDKYERGGEYKDYRREGFERRKEFSVREQPIADRKDSKDYANYNRNNFQRRSDSRQNKIRPQHYPRQDER